MAEAVKERTGNAAPDHCMPAARHRYVRGIFVQDDENGVLIDAAGRKVKLTRILRCGAAGAPRRGTAEMMSRK
jgi:hypothetical protein